MSPAHVKQTVLRMLAEQCGGRLSFVSFAAVCLPCGMAALLTFGTRICRISVRFIDRDGANYDVNAPIGSTLLEVAHKEDIDLEGACEGSLACSTCHLIVEDEAYFDKMPEASDDENDMLDLAFGLTETCAYPSTVDAVAPSACCLVSGMSFCRLLTCAFIQRKSAAYRPCCVLQIEVGVPNHCTERAGWLGSAYT